MPALTQPTDGSTAFVADINQYAALYQGGIVYDVKYGYGAAGDGTTNDTTAIQNAINAAIAAGGGTVYLPPGSYKITTVLTLGGNIHLRGAGRWASVILAVGCSGLTYDGTAAAGNTDITRDSIVLEDFGLRGDYTAAKIGIDFKQTYRGTTNRLLVERFSSHGIKFTTVFTHNIRDCLIQDNDGDGIYLGTIVTATTISGCEIRTNNGAGIHGLGTGAGVVGADPISIIGGAIENNNKGGLWLEAYIGQFHCFGVSFENNQQNNTTPAGRTGPGQPVVAYSVRIGDPLGSYSDSVSLIGCMSLSGAGSGATGYGLYVGHVRNLFIAAHHSEDTTRAWYIDPAAAVKNFRAETVDDHALTTKIQRSGNSTLNGTTGRVITHNVAGDVNVNQYKVVIIPTATYLGRLYVVKVSNSMTVYSTDAADAGAFDWVMIEDGQPLV